MTPIQRQNESDRQKGGRKDRQDGSEGKQLEGERWYFFVKGPRKRQWAFKESLEICGHDFRIIHRPYHSLPRG